MKPPRSLRIAAGLVAVQSLALAVWGAAELIRALFGHPSDRGTAVLLGVVVLIYAAGVMVAARGLWLVRRWAQTPTYMVAFFAIVVGIGQIHTLPGFTIPLIAVGVATVITASWPSSRAALGGI
jgi:Kef-type K+ transport system membrane component KefB